MSGTVVPLSDERLAEIRQLTYSSSLVQARLAIVELLWPFILMSWGIRWLREKIFR